MDLRICDTNIDSSAEKLSDQHQSTVRRSAVVYSSVDKQTRLARVPELTGTKTHGSGILPAKRRKESKIRYSISKLAEVPKVCQNYWKRMYQAGHLQSPPK